MTDSSTNFYMEIHTKLASNQSFLFRFRITILSFRPYIYFSHIAASSTVIDYVTSISRIEY